MDRMRPVIVIALVTLVSLSGCILEDDGPDGPGDLPPTGTTQGFLFPEVEFIDQDGRDAWVSEIGADYAIIHVIGSEEGAFRPQFPQLTAVLDHFDTPIFDTVVEAFTLSTDPTSTNETLRDLSLSMGASWPLVVPKGDLEDLLSLVSDPTVFILDPQRVILLRSDQAIGQGWMIEAIEDDLGVAPPENVGPEVGQTAPEVVWVDIDGNTGSLSELRGSPVLLDVWELECPFCIALFDELEKVHANYSAEGLKIVSIDIITWETEDQVRAERDTHNATWPFAIDGDNIQGRYDLWRLPQLTLIDADGVIQWTFTGMVHSSVISQEVERLI